MAYQTSMVKDLAISLEALSRINCEGAMDLYIQVAYSLQLAIDKTKKELRQRDEDETATTTDDEIPF